MRASIRASLVEIEHVEPEVTTKRAERGKKTTPSSSSTATTAPAAATTPSELTKPVVNLQADLEHAVLHQELMALKEERADLKAKVYLLEKEKESQDLRLSDRMSVEMVLRSHIQFLQEELGQLERGGQRHLIRQDSREAQLRLRVDELLDTLDGLSHNSEVRQRQAAELIEDLKRANR